MSRPIVRPSVERAHEVLVLRPIWRGASGVAPSFVPTA